MSSDYRDMLGFSVETDAPFWCARAIYTLDELPDLVPDRQAVGGDPHGRGELTATLNAGPLMTFLAKARDSRIPLISDRRIEHKERGIIILGSPNASGGYLYIAATFV